MRPVPISLVIGEKGSGVTTLLNAFRRRADVQGTLIVDGLAEVWNTDVIAGWLRRETGRTQPIVLAANDLRAPRHVLQALAENPDLAATCRLDAVTCAIDARTGQDQVEAAGPSGRFFATADRIVLTHTDRVRPGAVTRLAKTLKALNPPAPILRGRNGDIGPARLVDSGLFDPVDGSIDIDRWLCEAAFGFEATRRGGLNLPETALSRLNNENGVRFFAVTIDRPLDSAALPVFLKLLMADRGTGLLRLKSIVATEDHPDRPALIDGREHLIQPLLWLETWPTADRRARLVFSTLDCSETWIRALLATLGDRSKLTEMREIPPAQVENVG